MLENTAGCAVPQILADTANKAAHPRVPASREGAAYESNLDLVDQLWQVRKSGCGPQAALVPQYLSLTLNKLAQ
jgi:hypothetical protein